MGAGERANADAGAPACAGLVLASLIIAAAVMPAATPRKAGAGVAVTEMPTPTAALARVSTAAP